MAGNKNLAEDPYERLANAIILQAVADYRVALKKIKAHPKNRDAINAVSYTHLDVYKRQTLYLGVPPLMLFGSHTFA